MNNLREKQFQAKDSKIAITSDSNKLDGEIDPRFGRAGGFIIFDLESDDFEYLDNGSSQIKTQGAGIDTASKLINKGIKTILTGFVGPKAYKVLEKSGVKIVQGVSGMSVREAINLYKKGELSFSKNPLGGPKRKRS